MRWALTRKCFHQRIHSSDNFFKNFKYGHAKRQFDKAWNVRTCRNGGADRCAAPDREKPASARLTPDSSRFWEASSWKPGGAQPSFDKQFVRDYLISSGWDKKSPPPELPNEIVEKTAARYEEAYFRITGSRFNG